MGRVCSGVGVFESGSVGWRLDDCFLSCLGCSTCDDDGGKGGQLDSKKHGVDVYLAVRSV